jgi:hypothetical protein
MAAACHFPGMAAASLCRALALPGLLVLAGCGGSERTPADTDSAAASPADAPDETPADGVAMIAPVDPGEPSTCNAPAAEPFIGREADASARKELAAAVAPITSLRWVAPGEATTEDYNPQRLNVMLDLEGAIATVHCG